MGPDIAARLLELNREFYQRFASAFASKRPRLQPGAARVLRQIQPDDSVLDLGCGHGLAASAMSSAGHHGIYVGLDGSEELVEVARRTDHASARFALVDLADPSWPSMVEGLQAGRFAWILALAVLHHLPGDGLRREVMARARSQLAPEGRVVVSVWDFLASARWRSRVVPWETLSIRPSDVDPGDSLLDWREGGLGYRYVHHFTPEALSELAAAAGFAVDESFRSDGEGGRLGLYQVWRKGKGGMGSGGS